MDEEPSQEQPDPAEPQRRDVAARAGDLDAMARASEQATWRDAESRRALVPGVLSGEVGPKGRVASQLRDLSRHERSRWGEVPSGSVAPGGGRYLLLPMVGVALLLLVIAGLVIWAAGR